MKTPNRSSTRKLAEVVYGQLLEQIQTGKLIRGDKLPSEAKLSKAYNVSRSVTREALMQLQGNGLTRTHKGIGTFVTSASEPHLPNDNGDKPVAEYIRALEVRAILEVEAARLAALRHSQAQLEAIQAANAGLAEAIGRGTLGREEDIEFHNCIAQAAGNEIFLALLEAIGNLTTRTISASLQIGRGQMRSKVVEEHAAIIDAIAVRDSEGAATCMRFHLYQARAALTGWSHMETP